MENKININKIIEDIHDKTHIIKYNESIFFKYNEIDWIKQLIEEIVKQTIHMCAENAKIEYDDIVDYSTATIDKQSILETIDNIIF